ncbi:Uncharacterised protein [Yersinia nurmii]|uniref:Uncharacterized protein n=1 Tax=Yersinia nurmii TaxID=685706 RepID=A0ABP1Y7U9_9GAMM|nr:Uncharacterised protein [Yersinia nurmii]
MARACISLMAMPIESAKSRIFVASGAISANFCARSLAFLMDACRAAASADVKVQTFGANNGSFFILRNNARRCASVKVLKSPIFNADVLSVSSLYSCVFCTTGELLIELQHNDFIRDILYVN